MNEDFLHYIWKHRLYNFTNLKTVQNDRLTVVHTGFPHQDSGPDFKQAIIKLNDVTWAGDIEIHCKSSDWLRHKHHQNERYKSIILHVVYVNDMPIFNEQKEEYPTLELKTLISNELLERYNTFNNNSHFLLCKNEIENIAPLTLTTLFSRLIIERFLRKSRTIYSILETTRGDWHETFLRILAISFGFKTNENAFELLSKTLSYRIILKHSKSKFQLEALLFGQAGFLENVNNNLTDDYYQQLHYEYHYLKHQYRLLSIPESRWNLLRLHPQNFPCLRLAQLAEFLFNFPQPFQHFILNNENILKFLNWECQPDKYWENHFIFGKKGKHHSAQLGRKSAELLIINAFLPVMFAYGSFMGENDLQERAVQLLENFTFETNRITKSYKIANFPASTSLDSQAILELYTNYCSKKRCLHCEIGSSILKGNKKQK